MWILADLLSGFFPLAHLNAVCLLLAGGDRLGLPHQGGLDERQPPLLNQGQSRDRYHRLLLLGCSAGAEDGHPTLSF